MKCHEWKWNLWAKKNRKLVATNFLEVEEATEDANFEAIRYMAGIALTETLMRVMSVCKEKQCFGFESQGL